MATQSQVRLSRLARASLALGSIHAVVCSVFVFIVFMPHVAQAPVGIDIPYLYLLGIYAAGAGLILSLITLVLSISAVVTIWRSGGSLRGSVHAILGFILTFVPSVVATVVLNQ